MKKKIPFIILQAMQPANDPNINLVHPVDDDKVMLHLVDNDKDSHFYFKVLNKSENRSNQLNFAIERKPITKENLQGGGDWFPLDGIVKALKNWLDIIKSYNEIKTIYDDPITRAYEEQFVKDVNMVDEDADTAPFTLKQQLFLDNYLTDVKNKIELLKAGKTEEEVKELDDIINEAQGLQTTLTKLTKNQTVTKLSKIWSKAQKVGLNVLREIFVGVASEVITKLITGG